MCMQYLDLSDRADRLFFCGDIHGEYSSLVYNLTKQQIRNAIVVVAGDCGLGFDEWKAYDLKFNILHDELEQLNTLILLVRGNHDDPRWFREKLIDYTYVRALPDYTVVGTNGHQVLCVGGAVSLDRQFRISSMKYYEDLGKNVSKIYWEDEPMYFDEETLKMLDAQSVKIDTIVTHAAPSFYPLPFDKDYEHYCANDNSLDDEVRSERERISRLYDYLISHHHPVRNWFFGHYHKSGHYLYNETKLRMLDIKEIVSIDE